MTAPFMPEPFATNQPEADLLLQQMQAAIQMEPESQRDPNAEVAPNPAPSNGLSEQERAIALRKALYGHDFPLADDTVEVEDIAPGAFPSWVRGLWNSRESAYAAHIHLIERNRLFRSGQQWISAGGGRGSWSEPNRPAGSARLVFNMIDKALDQRLQIMMDQRPGFMVTPMTQDPDDKRKAQAQQMATEYQHAQQNMDQIAREAAFWAQTDGVSFWHVYWDSNRGPWDERMADRTGEKKPMGDLYTDVLRVDQVRSSSNATSTKDPHWVVIRDVISTQDAAFRYGTTGLDAAQDMTDSGSDGLNTYVLSQTTIGEGQRLRGQDVTERFTVYLQPHPDVFPEGMQMIVVGDEVVFGPAPLLWGVIPVVPVRDGSSDPSYLPRPIMEQWLDHQVRVNALISKWYENIRVNAGGRFLARPNSISTETLMGGVTSLIEVRGAGSIGDAVQPVQGFSVGNDVKEALAMERQAFENASGWNQVSRGQASGESGRAIIATREQLERVFTPVVQALAVAFTKWAKVNLSGMAWGYSMPRSLGAVGRGRPDLARAVSSSDFDGQSDVKVEAATMMPMPLAFRMYQLDNALQIGAIDMREYRRRTMFAMVRDMATPDEDQEARAKRVADAIRMREPVPEMRWQDNESIHQDVLERELLLQDDLEPDIIAAAQERWSMLAEQAIAKQGGMPPAPSPDAGPESGPAAASVPQMPAQLLPLGSSNPPIGVASVMDDATNEAEAAARQADIESRQQ